MDLVTFETGYSLHKTDSMRVKIPRSATYFAITTNCRQLIIFKTNFTKLIRRTIYIKSAVLLHNDQGGQNVEIKCILFYDLACDTEMNGNCCYMFHSLHYLK